MPQSEMNHILTVTDDEKNLVRGVQAEGHTITSIVKKPYEFRVHFNYRGGGTGSRAYIYNLAMSWCALNEDIARGEQELKKTIDSYSYKFRQNQDARRISGMSTW
jgi:outer membrane lipoprotein-sorting protein